MASIITNRGLYLIQSADVDLRDDTIKVMLLTSAYTPDATDNFVSDVVAFEASGTGYAGGFAGTGRKTLANKTFTEDDAAGTSTFDADNLTWSAITAGTLRYAAIIKEITTDADSLVIAIVGFTTRVTAGTDLLIAWHTNGIFRMSAGGGDTAIVYQVNYTATGAEGTDFSVTIGSTLASDTYTVVWAPKGVAVVPVIDLPDTLGADRTTTTFRVVTADVLTAGDKLAFVVFE